MKYRVLVTARSFASADDKALKYLAENNCELIRVNGANREELVRELPYADAVIAGLEQYDPSMIENGPNLKVISRYGVGYDKVDLAAAKKNGVIVTITPGANENSVADLAMGLMLSLTRNIPFMNQSIRNNKQERPLGLEMWQKTIGVVGVGRIGKGVIKRAKGFEMNVLCYDVYQDLEFASQYDAKFVDLDTLIRESDFISLHVPLSETTRNLISEKQLYEMKRTAILVNTARGGLVDENALYHALKNNEIYAAGLDATVAEPSYGSPLCSLDNCILTPHAGGATVDAVNLMSMMAAKNAVDVLKNGTCEYAVKY